MPTWTTPPTFVAGRIISPSDIATYFFGNDAYLLNRPGQTIIRNNAGAYTTTSTIFVDIDATNLIITLACSGAAVQVSFYAAPSVNVPAMLDFVIDGVRYGTGFANGLGAVMNVAGAINSLVGYSVRVVVAPGTRIFKPQWRVASGTGGLQSDPTTTPVIFSVQEVA